MTGEAHLLRSCLELLSILGVFHWRANAGGGLRRGRPIVGNPAGTADVLLVLPPSGRLVGVECKARGGRLRPEQAAWRDNLQRAGGLYWLVRDVRELAELLRRQGVC